MTKTTQRKSKPKGPAPSERDVREAAFASPDLAAAAAALGVADLQALLDGHKKLAAAWERGRFLRDVQAVAAKGIVKEEADRYLELPRGELVKRLAKDRVLADLWSRAAFEARTRARTGLMSLAETGDHKAMQLYERLLDVEQKAETPDLDFSRLTPTQMEAATGVKRQTILRWNKDHGLPRNVDGTYSLPHFLEWRIKWERDQTTGGRESAGMNPLQTLKAERIDLDLAEKRGRLLPRDEVVTGIVMRYQRLAQARRRAPDLGMQIQDQSPERVEQILGDFVDELCNRQIEDFDELRLPPPAEKIFTGLLEELRKSETEKGTADER